ncbi:M23 family metallopeptidase [Corticibacter populi]|uniref:M23 family metallopeptidase n=1 Tax=Corticibacter populi TaxID=1550736 RepID=A0A3M6QKT3_9BURK|nr:M23 family metallopeptidase [Corticibacter populi]RMX03072.1 M23 family metallopeptidase [Corticibacter populi]RZS33383.1 murein DD-endopeptidase MepM/ murein hydrolase activator NlpD [Corticibacter populi]
MQVIIADARLGRSYTLNLSLVTLVLLTLAALLTVGLAAQAWLLPQRPAADATVQTSLVSQHAGAGSRAASALEEERAQMRQSMDDMARKVGEMQAKLVQLQTLSERVSDLADIEVPAEATETSEATGATAQAGMAEINAGGTGAGGPLVAETPLAYQEVLDILSSVEARLTAQTDFFTVAEAQLFNDFLERRMIPTQAPVPGRRVGSPFGRRIDPITGRGATHTGLDFQAPKGTPILAAAGGVVITQEYHPAYGNMLEIDHGNNLITRYAHASKLLAKRGDVVRRGEKIAEVGSTGRSTGAHLHFEVLVAGQQQDPQKFLNAGQNADWSDLLAQQQR